MAPHRYRLQHSLIFLCLCLLLPSKILAQTDSVTISEVMFAPNSGNNEFIEIYNYGVTAVNLTGWLVDDSADVDTLKNLGSGSILNPKQYAVIFESDYDTSTGIYKSLIPSGALILKVNDTQIGNSLGNSGDRIFLRNTAGDTLSKYTDTSRNSTGISDEKIILDNDNSISNWTNSINSNGTPGNHAELILSLNDNRLTFSPIQPFTGDSVQISAIIKNKGVSASNLFSVMFYEDTNGNFEAETEELIDSADFTGVLNRNDSTTVAISFP